MQTIEQLQMSGETHDGRKPLVPAFEVDVFYDGQCPLCMREINLLKRLDRKNRIGFVDIAASDFDASALGISWDTLMERIHARLPDGSLIEGVEVFRRLYAAVGYRKLAQATRLPGLSQLLDLSYSLFAKNRLRLAGRCENDVCDIRNR